MGESDSRRKFPRPLCVQFANKIHKDIVMSQVSVLKEKKSKLRIASHQPEEVKKNRKKLYEIQQNYSAKNIEKKNNG